MTNIPILIQAYSAGAQLLRDAVRPTSNADLDARPIEGKWSIRELVCHLADSEIVYADRMKRVLAEQAPTFFDANPNLFVPALHCSQRQLKTEIAVIETIRAHMLPILQSCDSSDFHRTGVHSTDGNVTLQTLLERIVAHIPHHIAFIEEKLALLKP
ncbi:DinB family protein [Bythopirellula polymerisocia]|uniref:Putative metal-dependent hydrolase YfiT n=1 Tax=Bythopirellula polymerisocia TaxID=2528003 RepID=A0A5C6CUC2_9BACT|nr:DinB family protein [Bythopirellula polymerisocia]TWU28122.1 putative metal-dependent hydrolase YfiT [Bythopirellula polymerisocia]